MHLISELTHCTRAFGRKSPHAGFFFLGGGGEHPPDATEAFQLLPRRHLSLHHNGKDSLATKTGAVEQTPVM